MSKYSATEINATEARVTIDGREHTCDLTDPLEALLVDVVRDYVRIRAAVKRHALAAAEQMADIAERADGGSLPNRVPHLSADDLQGALAKVDLLADQIDAIEFAMAAPGRTETSK